MYKLVEAARETVVIDAVSYTPIMVLQDESAESKIPKICVVVVKGMCALVQVDKEGCASFMVGWPPEVLSALLMSIQSKQRGSASSENGEVMKLLDVPPSPPPPPYHLEGHDAFVAIVFHGGDKVRVDWNGMDKNRFLNATATYIQNLVWMDPEGRNAKLLHQMVDDIVALNEKKKAQGIPPPSHMESQADKPAEEKAPE